MHKAGVALGNMRICQPYGDDQRRGLWLFHLIEPETWARVVARVNGANSGALYINDRPGCHVEPLLFGGGQQGRIRPGTLPLELIAAFGMAATDR